MTLSALPPPQPKQSLKWWVNFHNHRKVEIEALSAFEADGRVYFTDIPQKDLFPLIMSGKAINGIVAAFDSEVVLYYCRMGTVRAAPATKRNSPKK